MDPGLYSELMRNSIMGVVFLVVVIPLALAYRAQAAELKDVQDRRAVDAQQTVEKLLTLNDKWNATVAEQIRTVQEIGSTMEDIKGALEGIRTMLMQRRP